MSERTARGPETIHELTRAQQAAGRRAAEARATVPDAGWSAEVDAPEPFDGTLLAAVAAALRAVPALNATHRDGTRVEHGRVNLAVAVATADATVAPVLLDADERDAAALDAELARLREAVAGGGLTAAAFAGATFAVTGLGVDGVRQTVPWVIPGQVAALGVGAPEDRPVVVDGEVQVRRRAELTLVTDARAVQGTAGPRFLAAVVAALSRV